MNWEDIVKYDKNYLQNVDDMIARALRVKTEVEQFYSEGGAEYAEIEKAIRKYVSALKEHKKTS